MKVSGNIIQIDENDKNPLRQKARLITKDEFGTAYLRDIIETMQSALAKESDGVALAAPQIALSLSIFVVAPSAYSENAKWKPLIFINPRITKISKKTATMQEGCLSVRWIYGKTNRSVSATVEAFDVEGNKFSYGATGLIAHIFQHEIDHLHGTLFIDHGFDFEEFTEEEMIEAEKKRKEESLK
ncbi:MAG: peptide deformylase [Candidatus Pacebacteria bacterium]|nr:peptide deformylase [Candidatus Paceibacterota bacterium]MBP9867123.1 peptide deformylase [Candidatus Paceibacterota bacterium]